MNFRRLHGHRPGPRDRLDDHREAVRREDDVRRGAGGVGGGLWRGQEPRGPRAAEGRRLVVALPLLWLLIFFLLPLGEKGSSGRERLEMSAGLTLIDGDEGAIIVDMVGFLSPAEKAGIDFAWQVAGVDINATRLPKELAYIPAFMLLGLIALLHRRRLCQNR